MTRTVQIFDRACCGPSAASNLADFLRSRTDADTEVDYYNLSDNSTATVRVPATVITHLAANGPLPVLAVDGQLVSAGTLPNLMDALDVATGRCEPSGIATSELSLVPAANTTCCS